MIFIRFLILGLLLTSALGVAGQTPRFDGYLVRKTYDGKNVKAIIGKEERTFRTRIRWAAKHGTRNFAGEYILGQIGCGAECRITFALNARTGRVSWIPFTICCWRPFGVEATEVRLDSRLLIMRGLRNEADEQYKADSMTDVHYYEMRNGAFRYIKTMKHP